MIEIEEQSSGSSQMPHSDSTVIAALDNPNLKITTTLFTGQNYLTWSKSVALYLQGRGKMGHFDGRIKAPDTTDPKYDKWEIENSTIMVWLINSMVPEIGESFIV